MPTQAFVGDAPNVAPLADAAAAAAESWCVALVSRGTARFFFGEPQAPAEESLGNFAQEPFEREGEIEIEAHLHRVADAIDRAYRDGRWKRLVLGTPHVLGPQVEALRAGDVREPLAGRFDADVENIAPDDVIREALAIAHELRERELSELPGRVEAGMPGPGTAAGAQPALEALHERRVEALLLAQGLTLAGRRCPSCGWLATEDGPERCPADGSELEPREDVLEDAIRAAIEQDARLLRVEEPERTPLRGLGVGAVLRF